MSNMKETIQAYTKMLVVNSPRVPFSITSIFCLENKSQNFIFLKITDNMVSWNAMNIINQSISIFQLYLNWNMSNMKETSSL